MTSGSRDARPAAGTKAVGDNEDYIVSERQHVTTTSRRLDLLGPILAIYDVSTRLLSDTSLARPDDYLADLKHIGEAAERMAEMVHERVTANQLDGDDESKDGRSRLRHDLLNELNPITNYSEMWIEDAEDEGLQPDVHDLQIIRVEGDRCIRLVGRILSGDSIDAAEEDDDTVQTETIVESVLMDDAPAIDRNITGSVLVADDNDTNRVILKRRLEAEGHTVTTVDNGLEALAVLQSQSIDIVLLDIIMPEMNGYDVLRRIRQDPQLKDLPVVMISALDEFNVVVRCMEAGADDYLPKPFNPVMLRARISTCLERRQLAEQVKQEQKRSDELLHVILPPEIVSELKETDEVKPKRYENVAVMFADLVNFTSYCEQHSAEEVVDSLQSLVESWEETLLSHRVQKIKTIGDCLMAACGLLDRVDNPVLNCLQVAEQMIADTRALNVGWDLRVGIHIGTVVAGLLGRRQYLFDLWGDAVNTAARTESHGVRGHATLSAEAWANVSEVCTGTSLGLVTIKGKGERELFRFDGFR